jgi:nicotinate-nucleotide pyrophosphorylase (carboxylating)
MVLNWRESLSAQVALALKEDVGEGDLSAALVAPKEVEAFVLSRESCTVCGQPWFDEVFRQLGATAKIIWHVKEGDRVHENTRLCTIQGKAPELLTAERTALNFLQTLSGTASLVSRYVDAVQGLNVQIVDTRKTIPGLRLAQKYAVRVAGGTNHRMGLYDGILIKENHRIAAGGIPQVWQRAQEQLKDAQPDTLLQIEVESLGQLEEALQCGAKLILLDNFDVAGLRSAVQQTKGRAILEASGNVSLDCVREIASTGVNRISIGSLTKHIRAVDLSMRFLESC